MPLFHFWYKIFKLINVYNILSYLNGYLFPVFFFFVKSYNMYVLLISQFSFCLYFFVSTKIDMTINLFYLSLLYLSINQSIKIIIICKCVIINAQQMCVYYRCLVRTPPAHHHKQQCLEDMLSASSSHIWP